MFHGGRRININQRGFTQVSYDTNILVKRLQEGGGLNVNAASTLSGLLSEALGTAVEEISMASATRADFERELSSFAVDLRKLKGELAIRQGETFQLGKQSMEQLLCELRTSRQRAREAFGTIRSEMRLEVNLERGRQRDAALSTALKFQDLQTRVDAEVGNAYASLAKLRHDIFYSLTGFLFTSIAALFGFLRLMS